MGGRVLPVRVVRDILARDDDVDLNVISSSRFAWFAAHGLKYAHELFRKYCSGDRQVAGAQLAENEVCAWDIAVVDVACH